MYFTIFYKAWMRKTVPDKIHNYIIDVSILLRIASIVRVGTIHASNTIGIINKYLIYIPVIFVGLLPLRCKIM